MNTITIHNPNELTTSQAQATFEQATGIISQTLSHTSQRVYQRTYTAWLAFCEQHDLNPLSVTLENVSEFIHGGTLAKTTRQNRLSHMRKLAQLLALSGNEQAERHYQAIKHFLKVKGSDTNTATKPRQKRALLPVEAVKLLAVWEHDDSPLGLRNHAMIRLLLFTGLRRSELVALRWDDLDLERHIITIRHGKGDKERTVAILDNSSKTQETLQNLQDAMGDRDFVFGAMTRSRTPEFADDTPTVTNTVLRVVARTAELAGIGDLKPHDLRRTHITEYLATGGTLADAQAQAGHANGETTLRYAQAVNAEQRRSSSRFRFG